MACVVVLLGVSGSGKTTVGKLLAEQLAADFLDADDFHPPQNIEKMRRGEPLDDDDRRPWLEAMAQEIRRRVESGPPAVFTCSGLKPQYRQMLRIDPSIRFFALQCSTEELRRRLSQRKGHFFPADLLDSQLSQWVAPSSQEGVVSVDGDRSPTETAREILALLGGSPPQASGR